MVIVHKFDRNNTAVAQAQNNCKVEDSVVAAGGSRGFHTPLPRFSPRFRGFRLRLVRLNTDFAILLSVSSRRTAKSHFLPPRTPRTPRKCWQWTFP